MIPLPVPNMSRNQGVTLLEVLVFVTILSMLFVGVAAATTSSLRRAQFNQRKIFATRFTEELEEWMRGEKEASWTTFAAKSAVSPGNIYCFNSVTLSWPAVGSCGSTYGLTNLYKREATLIGTGSQITVNIEVEWLDGANTFSVPVTTVFSQWE